MNRPKAMNAFDDVMMKSLASTLQEWKTASDVTYVVIKGEHKIFCAGGDLKGIAGDNFDALLPAIKNAYKIVSLVHNFTKPSVAIMDGITMGLGMGMSIPGPYRIITENSKLGMPEAAVGFFPDIGAAYFFNRCPGKIGLYLGLTATIIGPQDAMFTGLGTHYVPSEEIEELLTRIRMAHGKNLDEILQHHHRPYEGKAPFEAHQHIIDDCFNQPSVEKIFQALAQNGSEFAAQTLSRLKAISPLSLRATFDLFKAAETMTMDEVIEENLNRYLKWVTTPESRSELQEGVRALLIEKDKNPKWLSPPIEY